MIEQDFRGKKKQRTFLSTLQAEALASMAPTSTSQTRPTTPIACKVPDGVASDAWETCSGPVRPSSAAATPLRKVILRMGETLGADLSLVPTPSSSVRASRQPSSNEGKRTHCVATKAKQTKAIAQNASTLWASLENSLGCDEKIIPEILASLLEAEIHSQTQNGAGSVLLAIASNSSLGMQERYLALALLFKLQTNGKFKNYQASLEKFIELLPQFDANIDCPLFHYIEKFVSQLPTETTELFDLGVALFKECRRFEGKRNKVGFCRLIAMLSCSSLPCEHFFTEILSSESVLLIHGEILAYIFWMKSMKTEFRPETLADTFKQLQDIVTKRLISAPSLGVQCLCSLVKMMPKVLVIIELPVAPWLAKTLMGLTIQLVLTGKIRLEASLKVLLLDSLLELGSFLKSLESIDSKAILDLSYFFALPLPLVEKEAVVSQYKQVNQYDQLESSGFIFSQDGHLNTLIHSSLAGLTDRLIVFLLRLLSEQSVIIKVKSLRGLIVLVKENETILANHAFIETILKNCGEPAVSVRDAALELLGKIAPPDLLIRPDVFTMLTQRCQDSALLVRKRTVRMFRDIIARKPDMEIEEMLIARLIIIAVEDEESVADFAFQLVKDNWISKISCTSTREDLVKFVASSIRLITHLDSNTESLKNIIRRLFDESNMDASQLSSLFSGIVDILFESLISSVENGNAAAVNFVLKAISIFVTNNQQLLEAHIRLLLELTHSRDMKCIELSLHLLKEASGKCSKASMLHLTDKLDHLSSLILRGSEAVVRNGMDLLVSAMGYFDEECGQKLKLLASKFADYLDACAQKSFDQTTISLLCRALYSYGILLCSCLSHRCFFESKDFESFLQICCTFFNNTFESHEPNLISFYSLQSMGFIVSQDPKYALLPDICCIIQKALLSNHSSLISGSLKIFMDLLQRQTEHSSTFETSMQSDGFNTASTVFQSNLESILIASLKNFPDAQLIAIKLLYEIVQKGLCHPGQVLPTIVALSASSNSFIASRSIDVMNHLKETHSTFLFSNYASATRLIFKLYKGNEAHSQTPFRVIDDSARSLLEPIYDLIPVKQKKREDFINILIQEASDAFDRKAAEFGQFVLQTLALLPFKTIQEVAPLLIRCSDIIFGNDNDSESKRSKIAHFAILQQFLQNAYDLSIEYLRLLIFPSFMLFRKCERAVAEGSAKPLSLTALSDISPVNFPDIINDLSDEELQTLLDNCVVACTKATRPKSKPKKRKRIKQESDCPSDSDEIIDII